MISKKATTTGIKPTLYETYDFGDQGWNTPGDPRHSPVFGYLAQRFCAVGEAFFVRSPQGEWEKIANKSLAIARVYQEHGGTQMIGGVQKMIELDVIKAFVATGIVAFADVTYAPLAPEFLRFNGERRLNVYRDRRISGDDDHVADAEEFLKVIRNSLCGAPDEIDIVGMLDEIASPAPTAFRWVLHWLAVRYQRPGYFTQTNLWFIGGRGTGKGSLLSVLKLVFGSKAVGKVDASDIDRGWTTSLFGADFIEWDEFKSSGWRDLNRFIKEKTGNETFSVTRRNVGDTLQPFVGGQIITTNDRTPMFVEADDRQNSFIQTSSDPAWAARAKAMWEPATNTLLNPLIPSGFAALLNTIEVDYDFIRKPLKTVLRDELVETFLDDHIEQWLEDYLETTSRERPSWADLHSDYKAYVQRHASSKPKDLKAFKREIVLKQLGREIVGKDANRRSQRYVKLKGDAPDLKVVA